MTRLTGPSLGGPATSLQLSLQVILRHSSSSLVRLDLRRGSLRRCGPILEAVKEALIDSLASVAQLQVLAMPHIVRRAPNLIVQLACDVVALQESRQARVDNRAR